MPNPVNAVTPVQFAAMTRGRAKVRTSPPTPRTMNGTEQAYRDVLTVRKLAGEIVEFYYEDALLRVGHDCRYLGDFLLLMADGSLEVHECKGWKWAKNMVKLRAAAAKFWWLKFRLVEKVKGGWELTEIGGQ